MSIKVDDSKAGALEADGQLIGCRVAAKARGEHLDLRFEPRGPDLPDDNPKTAVGINKIPFHLIPETVLIHMAMGYADGGFKYQPFNFRDKRITGSTYIRAAKGHISWYQEGFDHASDSMVHHLAHAMCCLGMILDAEASGMLNDNRPAKNEGYAELIKSMEAVLERLADRDVNKFGIHDVFTGKE